MDHVVGPSGDTRSPLKHFTNAKRKINSIFSEIGKYIKEFSAFLESMEKGESGVELDKTLKEEVNQAYDQIFGIKEMLVRDHMKVVFFGRTSNGKSTVINSMLRDRILPSGIGHTTSCFLSIEGSDDDNDVGYILCGDSDERMSVESVMQLSHALSQESMSHDNLIQIFWPKKRCALLKDDVVLLDSPGIDVSSGLDDWIENYCMDADVFILVANAESTLMQTEKNFFHRVNSKLSKPNIFILNNRWDASASEPETMEQVRKQHMDRGIAFLADELKVIDKEQARNRVFFVSAKEALHSRVKKANVPESPIHTDFMAEGFQARLLEFHNFEREFEECISQHATRTKFSSHTQRAEKVIDVMFKHAQWLHDYIETSLHRKLVATTTRSRGLPSAAKPLSASDMIKDSEIRRAKLLDRLNEIDEQLRAISSKAREDIAIVSAETEKQVRSAMSDEIRRLPFLVDEFQRPFHPNPMVLRVYKTELYRHVQEGLGRNLTARCSGGLQKQIDRKRCDMISGVTPLLLVYPPDEKQTNGQVANNEQLMTTSSGSHPSFDISYDIECASLCSDFQEDIEFKFSLGVFQIIERLIGAKEGRRMRLGGVVVDNPAIAHQTPSISHPGIPDNHEGVHSVPQPIAPQDLALSLVRGSMYFTEAHSTAFIATAGMVPYVFWRSVGWKVLAFTGAAYCSLYLYERLTWTSRAKERALKRQFVEHATDKLNLIISFTSSNCSHQVQQELSGTFTRLCTDVDTTRKELMQEADELLEQIEALRKTQNRAKTLRNNAGWLGSELQAFTATFLGFSNDHEQHNGKI